MVKTYPRRFETCVDLDLCTRFAHEVIDAMESDTVNVFRPDDEQALDYVVDSGGAI